PAKFPESSRKAGFENDPELPPHMTDLFDRKERYTIQANNIQDIQKFIAENIS
ncbi:MAG: threonine synthase, partial [Cellvibrionales bacterium]|nr:threonine synthase [Cellvibrionales bacterium]